jgi:hypothetical protein
VQAGLASPYGLAQVPLDLAAEAAAEDTALEAGAAAEDTALAVAEDTALAVAEDTALAVAGTVPEPYSGPVADLSCRKLPATLLPLSKP